MHRSNQLGFVDPVSGAPVRLASRGLAERCSAARLARVLALGAAIVMSAGSLVSVAQAQSNPQQLAEANKKAMEEYNNLDIERAKASLEKAAKNAEKNGIRGPALARTLSNLAVVLVGGLGDQKGAVAAFTRALKEDPKVEPDPIVATPEVMSAYASAKANVGKSAPAPQPEEEVAPPARVESGPVESNLDHTPTAEQLSQTSVPIFVKKSADLEIANIKVYWRSLGMKKPKSQQMSETDDGYTFLIPCTDVYEPKVEYFLVASDSDGNPVGSAGTAENPILVPIVSTRTEPAPSLPGQVPPSQCSADDECPPGMPGCRGAAGMGDTCSVDKDCASGLMCDDDFCVSGERAEEESSSSSSGGFKKFFVEASVGVGLTSVGKGRAPDRSAKPVLMPVTAAARDTMTGDIDLDKAKSQLQARGFDCSAQQTTVMGVQQLQLTKCAVAVHPGGIVPVPVLNLAVGYNLSPKLAVALTGRFQIGHGEGPLAGILLGGRGEYKLSKPVEKGLVFSGLGGFGIGQMQARPPAKGSYQGPYATNAKLGGVGLALSLGAKAGYRFSKRWGVNVLPQLNFGLPNFLFALDLTAGLDVQF
jgi:hypothetical protein